MKGPSAHLQRQDDELHAGHSIWWQLQEDTLIAQSSLRLPARLQLP